MVKKKINISEEQKKRMKAATQKRKVAKEAASKKKAAAKRKKKPVKLTTVNTKKPCKARPSTAKSISDMFSQCKIINPSAPKKKPSIGIFEIDQKETEVLKATGFTKEAIAKKKKPELLSIIADMAKTIAEFDSQQHVNHKELYHLNTEVKRLRHEADERKQLNDELTKDLMFYTRKVRTLANAKNSTAPSKDLRNSLTSCCSPKKPFPGKLLY